MSGFVEFVDAVAVVMFVFGVVVFVGTASVPPTLIRRRNISLVFWRDDIVMVLNRVLGNVLARRENPEELGCKRDYVVRLASFELSSGHGDFFKCCW